MADLRQFDVQGARDAGYSGAEIQLHLMHKLGYPPALAKQATAPREKMGPPEAPRSIGMPSDTSFGEAVSKANPMPEWYQRADAAVNQPFSMGVTGGPVGSLADITPVIPQSKTEAALLAAGALIPPAKILKGAKGAVLAGTRMLEGAAPEVGQLSRGMALAEASTEFPLYPKAGTHVDGLKVRRNIPNMDSIKATLGEDYEELPGVREVPLDAFGVEDNHWGKRPYGFYDAKDADRVEALSHQIKDSGEISPLIVVIDKEGPYILEGSHRVSALARNGHTTIPAKVIIDRSESGVPVHE